MRPQSRWNNVHNTLLQPNICSIIMRRLAANSPALRQIWTHRSRVSFRFLHDVDGSNNPYSFKLTLTLERGNQRVFSTLDTVKELEHADYVRILKQSNRRPQRRWLLTRIHKTTRTGEHRSLYGERVAARLVRAVLVYARVRFIFKQARCNMVEDFIRKAPI